MGFDDAQSMYVACFVLAQRQVSSHSHRSATLIYLLKFKVSRVNRVNCFDLFESLTKRTQPAVVLLLVSGENW